MLAYRVTIITRPWTVQFLPKGQFVKKYGENTLAVTETDERLIILRIDKMSLETTAHELTHAYVEEFSAPTMELTTDQMEELCCDILAKHSTKIMEQASYILHAYKVLRGRKR